MRAAMNGDRTDGSASVHPKQGRFVVDLRANEQMILGGAFERERFVEQAARLQRTLPRASQRGKAENSCGQEQRKGFPQAEQRKVSEHGPEDSTCHAGAKTLASPRASRYSEPKSHSSMRKPIHSSGLLLGALRRSAIALFGLALSGQLMAQEDAGPARAEALLAAMGGRAAWSKVKFVQVEAIHDDVEIRNSFTNKIWNDFSAPRVRFEAKNGEIDRRSAIEGAGGWRWRDGERKAMTPQQFEDERSWWEANIYRTLHRLALKDPELSARAVGKNRLEIFRSDGKRLNWFILNQRGEPMLFGTWASEAGTTFGPLASSGEIKYPKWGARPDGSWRYEVVRLEGAEKVPESISFSTP